MTVRQSIVFNGDLGSGKSTVSVEIAKRLGLRRVSVGDLYRQMAQERQMTALQLNLHAELDQAVDGYVDQLQRDIAASGESLVMDSRLAWHFFTDALKVHMITEPAEAARRVLAAPVRAGGELHLAGGGQGQAARAQRERAEPVHRPLRGGQGPAAQLRPGLRHHPGLRPPR